MVTIATCRSYDAWRTFPPEKREDYAPVDCDVRLQDEAIQIGPLRFIVNITAHASVEVNRYGEPRVIVDEITINDFVDDWRTRYRDNEADAPSRDGAVTAADGRDHLAYWASQRVNEQWSKIEERALKASADEAEAAR